MKIVAMGLWAVLILGACGSDGYRGDGEQGPTTEAEQVGTLRGDLDQGSVEVTVDPDPPVAGETAVWSFTVINTGDDSLTLTFPSGQRGEVVLARDGDEVYRWSDGRVFTQAIEEVTVEAGAEEVFELTGTLDVEPGVYELTAALTADPAPSPMERTIEVVGDG